jgi:SAM-dependent methyltransferase
MSIKYVLRKLINYVRPKYLRTEFVNSIPKDISILEIGPFYKPVCRGSKVKYFDILDQAALVERAKAIDSNNNTDNVPYIHFVSPTGDLSIIHETFDAVFSSHVIEHQLDLIKHLQQTSRLLNKGGKYYLIIPDKRYCFDHFNHESTIADVINAHFEKRKKHSLKSVIEHRALTTHNNSSDHWGGEHGVINDISDRIKNAITEHSMNEYVDVHAFYFTPNSFSQIINLLNQLGYIDFVVNWLHETSPENFEFYCILEKVQR